MKKLFDLNDIWRCVKNTQNTFWRILTVSTFIKTFIDWILWRMTLTSIYWLAQIHQDNIAAYMSLSFSGPHRWGQIGVGLISINLHQSKTECVIIKWIVLDKYSWWMWNVANTNFWWICFSVNLSLTFFDAMFDSDAKCDATFWCDADFLA